MRIIAGEARGRSLTAPKGTDTRPTLDRVRESLFNIVRLHVPDANVLDLFAGSGSLGLEALSRGAAHATFVDSGRAAQAAVLHNIAAVGVADRSVLLRCDWRTALSRLAADGAAFDLVFLDPPYGMPGAEAMLEALRTSGVLAEGSLTVYEHAKACPPDTSRWQVWDVRPYGDTTITFLSQQ